MNFNKEIGDWCEYTSELDNYAYYLYIKYENGLGGDTFLFKQHYIMEMYNENNSYVDFYKKARDILRKEKIKNIINDIKYEN